MAKKTSTTEQPAQAQVSLGSQELANALIAAMEAVKPVQKKTPFNRVRKTPWTPPLGTPQLKLKRKCFQHGLPINADSVSNEEIALLNKVRPGTYCDGFVRVFRRRDKGIDIDYKHGTASQRLKLVNQFGIRNFAELLQQCITEADRPRPVEIEDEE